jgi:hypothetical protein
MTEFGYALSVKKHAAMMPVMNIAFGLPEELPFDMGHLRHPIQYSVEPTAKDPERRAARDSLSKKLEEKLRLQIAATQPPPPAPVPFPKVEPKDGLARFRASRDPIGKRWDDIPFPNAHTQDVSLPAGPAIWFRLMPVVDPRKTWPAYELKKHAIGGGQSNLAPFVWCHIFVLRAEDGLGLCDLMTPEANETASVAFAFETGEVWSVDTTLLTYDAGGLLTGEIERLYTERILDYARFLTSLGLAPPYQWISVCLAKCNSVIHSSCNNVTSARCILFILKALLL